MADLSVAAQSFADSIKAWPQVFKDLDNGGDTVRWAEVTFQEFAPALLVGQEPPGLGITIGGIMDRDVPVEMTFPAFLDSDPIPETQAGVDKVKFHGKKCNGVFAITRDTVYITHGMGGAFLAVASYDLSNVIAINELTFKVSLMSITSAGPGYEILCRERDGVVQRFLFRVALTPRNPAAFTSQLRQTLMGKTSSGASTSTGSLANDGLGTPTAGEARAATEAAEGAGGVGVPGLFTGMEDGSVKSAADHDAAAVEDPSTSAQELADIAYQRPDLRIAVAAHAAAYPGLLDWLANLGDPALVDAVVARRARAENETRFAADQMR